MSLQAQPSAERVHIAFFGVRNAGKSSVVNAVTGQDLSVVSDVGGTTTDPVQKSMELLPLGPVVIIDTPGIDDVGALGEQRVLRARKVLRKTDIAVLVVSAETGMQTPDRELIGLFRERELPYVVVFNKIDLAALPDEQAAREPGIFRVSALTGEGIHELKEALGRLAPAAKPQRVLVEDLAKAGDLVILVTPIDTAAPKGRLILPQQMVLRGLLDIGAIPVVCRESEYPEALKSLGKQPRLVITDSQVFKKIDQETPEDIPLTSFSILMARYKGTLQDAVRGARELDHIWDGDVILISEGCTHHRQCDDIGTVKMPAWIRQYTGKQPEFRFTSGGEFPLDLEGIRLIVHCGGCMLNEKEMRSRAKEARAAGVPMTNYGTAIAKIHGILDRSVEPVCL
ncbi:MAG: [Eubacterium sp.]|nr:[FeFe] hydrogenase H-cluster maturation GTPase HydF [Eubacterium sp.]